MNSAGRHFHNWYGFGAVDVDSAIRAARTFVAGSLGLFQQTPWVESAAGAQAIPDFARVGVTSTLAVPAYPASLTVEEMQIEGCWWTTRRPATWASSSSARPARGASS